MSHDAHVVKSSGGPHSVSSKTKTLLGLALALGVAAFVGGLMVDSKRAWVSFAVNHFFFLSLAIGGLFFAAIQWIVGAAWSVPVRRIAESFTAYLPVALGASFVLFVGIPTLYHWSHVEAVRDDLVLSGKAGYLNVPFFVIRAIVIFGLWIFFSKKLIGNSLAQDTSADPTLSDRNRSWTPAFLIVFALSYTLLSIDVLMSLDPHWFSTIFGVYCFAGTFLTVNSLMAVIAIRLRQNGVLAGWMNENHVHDLGKWMFAFTVFWAYIAFSQFMLIWYANMPEETGFYLKRFEGGWLYLSVFLLVGKFFLPFFVLLPRDAKRNERLIVPMGIYILACQWIDYLWIAQPEFFKDGPRVGWIELGVTAGFVGLFGLAVTRFWSKHAIVAKGDPNLEQALAHHQ